MTVAGQLAYERGLLTPGGDGEAMIAPLGGAIVFLAEAFKQLTLRRWATLAIDAVRAAGASAALLALLFEVTDRGTPMRATYYWIVIAGTFLLLAIAWAGSSSDRLAAEPASAAAGRLSRDGERGPTHARTGSRRLELLLLMVLAVAWRRRS